MNPVMRMDGWKKALDEENVKRLTRLALFDQPLALAGLAGVTEKQAVMS